MRRSVMAVLAATVAVGAALIGVPAAQAAESGSPAPAPSGDYTPPPIKWGTCDNATLKSRGAQCGFVVVPLDYAKPAGTKIEIAVSRIKHTSPDKDYQGPILFNPGGPGGSGLIYAVLGSSIPGGAADSYDKIGFDPRGVGSSKPAISCDPDYAGYNRPDYEPTKTPGALVAWLKKSSQYAQACRKNGEILNHLTTLDTVKDIDSIRKALGEKQINFYGFSYGTYLAQVYATVYPQNLKRAVMDGVVRPSGVWYADNIDQDYAFQKSIEVYFDWVAKYDSVYHLGNTGDAVEKLYYATQDKLRKAPAGGKIGPAEWNDIFTQAAYYVFGWEDITQAFSDYVNKGDQASVAALIDLYPAPGDDNGYAVYLAVQCTDAKWPSLAKALIDNYRVSQKAPFLAWNNGWFNVPCTIWPAKAQKPVKVDGSKAAPFLLINETLDPATPYNGALEVRGLFPKSVLIEGVGGTTHAGSLSGIDCTDLTIAAYLKNGALPARVAGNTSDKKCDPVPQPDPTAASGARAAASGASGAAVGSRGRIG